MGYESPTPIQAQCIPLASEGIDLLGLAQTGTGKTAGFALPILQKLMRGPFGRIRALIIVPTRELCEQVRESFVFFGRNTKLRSMVVYGGVGKYPQARQLLRGPEILVACPGRLLDHLGDGIIDLSGVEVLVLDEADTMCDMGFLPDVRRIISFLPNKRQTLLFAATMPDGIRRLANKILNDPVTVQIGVIGPAETVSHFIYPVRSSRKKELLLAILDTTPTGRVMIFTRTKNRAQRLASELHEAKYKVGSLQGDLSQRQRLRAIDGFKMGKFDFLVATDLAARGIDVTEVSHVINYDMPGSVDDYIHRIGRTGRAEKSGEAFTFCDGEDYPLVRKIEAVLGTRIESKRIPEFDYGTEKSKRSPEFDYGAKRHRGSRSPELDYGTKKRRGSRSPTHKGFKRPYNR